MPIPPSLAKALSYTSTGIPFATVLDGYSEHWAANANMIEQCVIIGFEDTDDFRSDAVGYTTWDGSSGTLQRVTPLATPSTPALYCDEIQLLKKGVIRSDGGVGLFAEGATNLADPFNNNFPVWDWSMYKLTYRRPPWWVYSDTALAAIFSGLEQFRYVEFSQRFVPRLRKKPGYVFEYNQGAINSPPTANWQADTETGSGFAQDYQIEYLLTWKQVPISAIPWTAIQDAMNSVNLNDFSLGMNLDQSWDPGTLAFKGPANPISFYAGADGQLYADIQYIFGFQPGGWNNYRLNALNQATDPPTYQYVPIRARGLGDSESSLTVSNPPFISTDFDKLFTPASG